MIRIDGAGRSILFAAAAALGWFPCLLVAGSRSLGAPTLAWYLAAVTAAYVAALPAHPGQRLRAALLGGAAAGLLAAASPSLPATLLGLAVLLAVGRSVFVMGGRRRAAGGAVSPVRAGRALAIELGLAAAGLTAAVLLSRGAASNVMGVALGIWGYFAVQSLFFWIGGGTTAPRPSSQDPFEAARARAMSILGSG